MKISPWMSKKWLKSSKELKEMKKWLFFEFFNFFHFFHCERYILLKEIILTFLEMGDHILRDYTIKMEVKFH